jgi:hypothetical protein
MKHITSLLVGLWLAAVPAFATDYGWHFLTSANPSSTDTGSSSSIAITVGDFGTGWNETLFFSNQTGFWDTGMSGYLAGSISTANTSATVDVVEWYDGWIYGTPVTLSLSSGSVTSESYTTESSFYSGPFFGYWTRHTFTVSVPTSWSYSINGAAWGSVVDSVSIHTY